MIDLSQFQTVVGLAVLIGIIVQFVKGYLTAGVIPWVAIVLGIVLAVVIGMVKSELVSSEAVVSYVIGGLLAGLTAIGGYESSLDKLRSK